MRTWWQSLRRDDRDLIVAIGMLAFWIVYLWAMSRWFLPLLD